MKQTDCPYYPHENMPWRYCPTKGCGWPEHESELDRYRRMVARLVSLAEAAFIGNMGAGKKGWDELSEEWFPYAALGRAEDKIVEAEDARRADAQQREISDALNYLVFAYALVEKEEASD